MTTDGPYIDAYATAPWYIDHIAPIWQALGPHQGRFHVRQPLLAYAKGLSLDNLTAMPVGGGGRGLLTVGYGDMSAARAAGRTRLALGQHGAGQSYSNANPSYPGGGHQEGVGLFLVPNDTARRRTLATYPNARVAVVGCPKTEALPRRQPDAAPGAGPVVALGLHWDAHVTPESGSAWLHFRVALLDLARTYTVLGHGHPRAIDRMAPYYRGARIEVVRSFPQVLERADVYVCDNSSSLFEFASTGRPVVVLNAPTYRLAVNHGLRFEPSDGCALQAGRHWCGASHVGPQANGPREVAAAVARALERRPADEAARETALGVVYQPRRGGAALAARALVDWAA